MGLGSDGEADLGTMAMQIRYARFIAETGGLEEEQLET